MKIYVETSIPSFYHETRTDARSRRIRGWTRRWWDERSRRHDLVTSRATLTELARGSHPRQKEKVALVQQLPRLPITPAVDETATVYIDRKVMPSEELGDAYHFATASHHRCDVLLTNNVAHLANPNKFAHIRRVNEALGLFVPALKTPQEMIEESRESHPTIESIRQTRREIAAEHDFDPKKLGAYFRKLDQEEEEAHHTGALGELRTLVERLEKREQEAEAKGMQALAKDLFEDRARLTGAVERLSRRQREPGTAGAK